MLPLRVFLQSKKANLKKREMCLFQFMEGKTKFPCLQAPPVLANPV